MSKSKLIIRDYEGVLNRGLLGKEADLRFFYQALPVSWFRIDPLSVTCAWWKQCRWSCGRSRSVRVLLRKIAQLPASSFSSTLRKRNG